MIDSEIKSPKSRNVTEIVTTTITMSLEAARKLSIPELLRVLGEKFGIEYSRVREISLPLAASAESLEHEVCTHCHTWKWLWDLTTIP